MAFYSRSANPNVRGEIAVPMAVEDMTVDQRTVWDAATEAVENLVYAFLEE